MSAKAGWYPDPGGGQGLYRYWDGKAWSAATSPNPKAPAPSIGLTGPAGARPGSSGQTPYQPGGQVYGTSGYASQGYASQGYGGQGYGGQGQSPYPPSGAGQTPYGSGQGSGYGPRAASAYAGYQQTQKRKSPVGWWIGGAALLVVLIVIGVLAVRTIGGGGTTSGGPGPAQGSQNACPTVESQPPESPIPQPNDGRVHGGPLSYPTLGSPWSGPQGDSRVPFGRDVQSQLVTVEPNYDGTSNWVASVLVGELQAGDGFYTPQQGSQIVVRCILGAFYGDNPVSSDVKVNKATTVDGHEAWLVESQLTFDIPNLRTKGELLIVAIVATGSTAGLYYASIPDTTPELVAPARQALAQLKVDA